MMSMVLVIINSRIVSINVVVTLVALPCVVFLLCQLDAANTIDYIYIVDVHMWHVGVIDVLFCLDVLCIVSGFQPLNI